MNAPAAILKNVSLAYGKGKRRVIALDDISITIPRGQITGIMGPDAAGKTTLMRLLAGLLQPDSGVYSPFGSSIDALKKKKPNVAAYMPQRFGLYEDLTVAENLNLYANLRGVAGPARDEMIKRMLAFTNLAPFTGRLASALSGGMKQKLGIACALFGEPELLLLDEPGVGVDPRSRRELWEMVKDLSSSGVTVVWATSYIDEAARCSRLVVLEAGKILFEGEPSELTREAAGNVFTLNTPGDGKTKRDALLYWCAVPGVVDVVVRGDFVRLETGGKNGFAAAEQLRNSGAKPVPPELGDAYIAAVGGLDKRKSPFEKSGTPLAKSQILVEARGLTKKFGSFVAAKNITFNVRAGEIMGLLGPNGAGKSTTFRMLCGLSRPDSGECFVAGVNMLDAGGEARQGVGYVAQNFSLYADLSVRENIYIAGRLYGLSRDYIKTAGLALAEALDLRPFLKRQTGDLSLGLKRRLALLCATLHRPRALFLDEPTSGVDIRGRRDFWKHIAALTASGVAAVVTTHFMEEAEYCDKLALIYRGNVIKFGSPPELVKNSGITDNPDMEKAFIEYITRYDEKRPL